MEAFLNFVRDHWHFAIIMFGMSFAAVVLLVWRILLNIHSKTNMDKFLPLLQEALNKGGIEAALKLCRAQPRSQVIPTRLFVAGLENARQGAAAMRRAMAAAIELDILPRLNFLLPPILAIGKIATMVGLLGTVISMIGTFQTLAQSSEGQAAMSHATREIGLALFATALGLLTAIPLVFAYVLFKAWVQSFETQMKAHAQKLILLVQAHKQAKGARPDVRTGAGAAS